ncbi:hypothetical protein [Glycomyces salinus]|uniref:hypothetical protein n=1 Tax=Glycomyces salinus TaxID=980294 RepID=UPI0018EC63AF|nr:hypothetical protein [Glycomyces salinus]
MSNPQQPPADGWQPPNSPPQQEEQPVYRPNEQPPGQEPPPWSPESQQMGHPGSQQPPMEDEGTVKYTQPPGHPSQPQAPFGPPPGVPVSPFDAPPAGVPASGMPASGIPASGMPAQGYGPGMPPVSSVPASGMPVSPGQGQFGPPGGQLVPVSSGPGGQPWGGAQPGQIQRKKKKGGRGPLWILLIGIAVIAGALGLGGFILFNPDSDQSEPNDGDRTGTIENQSEEEPVAVGDPDAGVYFVAGGSGEEIGELPEALPNGTGVQAGDASASVGLIDLGAIGAEDAADEDNPLGAVSDAFGDSLAATAGGEAADTETVGYWVDARQANFSTFTVGDTTVIAAVIDLGDGTYAGFAGFATNEDETEAIEAMRQTLQFGEPEM